MIDNDIESAAEPAALNRFDATAQSLMRLVPLVRRAAWADYAVTAVILIVGHSDGAHLVKLIEFAMDGFAFAIVCPLCLVLALIKPTRAIAGVGLTILTQLLLLALMIFCAREVYSYWSWVGIVAASIFAGYGIIPAAFLASILHGNWATPVGILFDVILLSFSNYGGPRLYDGHLERNEKPEYSRQRVNSGIGAILFINGVLCCLVLAGFVLARMHLISQR